VPVDSPRAGPISLDAGDVHARSAPADPSARAVSIQSFHAGALIVFAIAVALTLSSARMMNGAMPMAGGWTMAMAWMRMPGQTWLGGAAMFAGMWLTMMVAMMLPSSLPMLLLYRRVIAFRGERHPAVLIWMMASAYFVVWTLFGVIAYGAGVSIAAGAMVSPRFSAVIPAAAGAALVAAGIYQLTAWKSACLEHCRDPLEIVASHLHPGWRGAIALGVHHGLFCTGCCWALMVMQLVMGVMNLGAMALIAAVIALEKLLPRGPLVARAAGIAAIAAGAITMLRAGFAF
jgi:predicted metal-binding membrane protein